MNRTESRSVMHTCQQLEQNWVLIMFATRLYTNRKLIKLLGKGLRLHWEPILGEPFLGWPAFQQIHEAGLGLLTT